MKGGKGGGMSETSGSVRCPDPDCRQEIGDPTRLSGFLEAERHADEDHGSEVSWFRGREGWILRYEETGSDSP